MVATRPRTINSTEESRWFSPDQKWVNLDFDLLLKIDDAENPENRLEILQQVEAQMRRAGSALGRRMAHGGEKLGNIFAQGQESQDLFRWLPITDRQIVMNDALSIGFLAKQFDLAIPLVGQSAEDIDTVICEVHTEPWQSIAEPISAYAYDNPEDLLRALTVAPRDPSQDVQLMVVRISSVVFQQGSVFPWIRGHIQELTLAATLLTAGATLGAATAGDLINREIQGYRLRAQISLALKDQPMAKYRNFDISYDELERKAIDAFNYEEPGLSDDERRWRIATMQVALKIDLRTNLKVDGQIGPDTMRDMQEFGRKHNHPVTVKNKYFRADLLNVLSPRN